MQSLYSVSISVVSVYCLCTVRAVSVTMCCLYRELMTNLRDDAKLNLPSEIHGGCDDGWGQDGCIAVAVGPQGQVG